MIKDLKSKIEYFISKHILREPIGFHIWEQCVYYHAGETFEHYHGFQWGYSFRDACEKFFKDDPRFHKELLTYGDLHFFLYPGKDPLNEITDDYQKKDYWKGYFL